VLYFSKFSFPFFSLLRSKWWTSLVFPLAYWLFCRPPPFLLIRCFFVELLTPFLLQIPLQTNKPGNRHPDIPRKESVPPFSVNFPPRSPCGHLEEPFFHPPPSKNFFKVVDLVQEGRHYQHLSKPFSFFPVNSFPSVKTFPEGFSPVVRFLAEVPPF